MAIGGIVSCTRSGCGRGNEFNPVVRGKTRRVPQANLPHRFAASVKPLVFETRDIPSRSGTLLRAPGVARHSTAYPRLMSQTTLQ